VIETDVTKELMNLKANVMDNVSKRAQNSPRTQDSPRAQVSPGAQETDGTKEVMYLEATVMDNVSRRAQEEAMIQHVASEIRMNLTVRAENSSEKPPLKVVILGPPASNRGAVLEAVVNQSGSQWVKEFMILKAAQAVNPDDVSEAAMTKALQGIIAGAVKGCVIEGYPRTVAQEGI